MIQLQNICARYGKTEVLSGITIDCIEAGSIVAVIGPNGTGKTTLFKCIAGILKPSQGAILYNHQNIKNISIDMLAKHICYMPQNTFTNASLTVFEVVLMAKKFATGQAVNKQDITNISKILYILGIEHLAKRYVSGLSGGQSQLVSLAQTLVRSPDVLLLDEPTSALDLHHQIEALDLIRMITQKTNMTTFVSLHDLGLAGRYADYIMILHCGKLYAYGTAQQVLTCEMLESVYQVQADIINNEKGVFVVPIQSLNSNLTHLEESFTGNTIF